MSQYMFIIIYTYDTWIVFHGLISLRQEEVSLRFMAPQSPAVHGTPSKRSVDIPGVYYHNIPIMSGPISTTMKIWDINHNDYIYYDVTLRILYHYCSTRIWDIWDILNYISTILLASCYYNIIMGLNGFKA